MKKIKYLWIAFILTSCLIEEDEDVIRDGFQTNFFNLTNSDYNGKIIVGGYKNNFFVATDSINLDTTILSNRKSIFFTDVDRWLPDLSKIRAIPSERCFFKIKLSNGRKELITRFNSTELMSLKLPSTNYFRGNFGFLSITIDNNQISGHAIEEE